MAPETAPILFFTAYDGEEAGANAGVREYGFCMKQEGGRGIPSTVKFRPIFDFEGGRGIPSTASQIKRVIDFYSILFYSILFYSFWNRC